MYEILKQSECVANYDPLPLQLPGSQQTDIDMFSEQGSVSQDVLQQYLTPGALDGFLGVGMDADGNFSAAEGGENMGRFTIPDELLVKMPIAEVTPTTKIIHIGKATQPIPIVTATQSEQAIAPIPPPPNTQAGPSHVIATEPQHEPMDMDVATGTAIADAVTPKTIVAGPSTEGNQAEIIQPQASKIKKTRVQVKKGVNTKNPKTKPQVEAQPEVEDDTLKDRMSILGEITRLMKASYGSRRNEVEVWGQYIGIKASRLSEGRRRDRVFMGVEELINEAIYEEMMDIY